MCVDIEQIESFDHCRNITQRDEIARIQLDNGVLQEKLINEKRKVTLLEVKINEDSSFLFIVDFSD